MRPREGEDTQHAPACVHAGGDSDVELVEDEKPPHGGAGAPGASGAPGGTPSAALGTPSPSHGGGPGAGGGAAAGGAAAPEGWCAEFPADSSEECAVRQTSQTTTPSFAWGFKSPKSVLKVS
jgi:hypothetical protein